MEGPLNGSLNLNSDGSFSYVPEIGYIGFDRFNYSVTDGEGSGFASVTLEMVGVENQPPVSIADSYNVFVNESLATISEEGVLSNDSDPEFATITATLQDDVSNGVLSLDVDGSFAYTPSQDFEGLDSFTYIASDGINTCLLYTSPSPRDQRGSRMPSSA